MWQLAFRNIFRQRMRTALTLAAIVFGVVGVILTQAVQSILEFTPKGG